MSGHIYVLGYRYCLFSVIFFEILEPFRQRGILELFRQRGILELFRQRGILELFRQRGIFSFYILLLLK